MNIVKLLLPQSTTIKYHSVYDQWGNLQWMIH